MNNDLKFIVCVYSYYVIFVLNVRSSALKGNIHHQVLLCRQLKDLFTRTKKEIHTYCKRLVQ